MINLKRVIKDGFIGEYRLEGYFEKEDFMKRELYCRGFEKGGREVSLYVW